MNLGKSAHGMKFGWHQRVADNWRIGLTTHKGCLQPIHDTSDITGEMLVKFGNNFDDRWIHPNAIPHANWYFWDNPEIPQLLNPNPANPTGDKTFVRFPRGSLFSTHDNTQPDARRLSQVLDNLAPGTTLENLVRPVPVRVRNSRRVLLCPSNPQNYAYYYNTTRSDWLTRWISYLEKHGFDPVVRDKPSRPQRVKYAGTRLYDHLVIHDYHCTISQHSVAALESIMAGTPAVVTGPHPGGELVTDQKEFVLGMLRTPEPQQVWNWIVRVASNTYHKSELFSGSWHR